MTVYTLFGQPASPATLIADTSDYTMGMQFSLSAPANLTGIWFYSGTGAGVLPSACGIFAVAGQAIVPGTQNNTPTWSGAAGSGWVKCTYPGTTTLAAGTAYKVAIFYGGGANFYSATSHYWDSGPGAGGLTSGIITAPNNAGGDGGQDTFQNPAISLTYPPSSFGAANYWIDVEVTAGGTSHPLTLPASASIGAVAFTRSVGWPLTAAMTTSAAVLRGMGRRLAATVAAAGRVLVPQPPVTGYTARPGLMRPGLATPGDPGVPSTTYTVTLAALVSVAGALGRATRKSVAATVATAATLIQILPKALTVLFTATGARRLWQVTGARFRWRSGSSRGG